MVNCKKCNEELEIWDVEEAICNNCGTCRDLQDEEEAKNDLLIFLRSLLPEGLGDDEDPCPVLEVDWFMKRLQVMKQKADYHDKIKSCVSNWMSEIWINGLLESKEMNKYRTDLLFSIYHETNQNKTIKIYKKNSW